MTRRGAAGAGRPPWITVAQLGALRRVVALLDAMRVPYRITGGLAGNLHGSTWPVHDIDLDVPSEALGALAARMRAWPGAVVSGPGRYRDEEFELDLLELALDGVEFDLSGASAMSLYSPAGERRALVVDFDASDVREAGGLALPVIPLAELLRYKRFIGRSADVADLERLD
ncbi:MAG TPA: hypothetical protein VMT93_05365 [Gemmatimonadaceae bacterium]|nr:hypothetical protein [Gemmatimonadaceae bacterium]